MQQTPDIHALAYQQQLQMFQQMQMQNVGYQMPSGYERFDAPGVAVQGEDTKNYALQALTEALDRAEVEMLSGHQRHSDVSEAMQCGFDINDFNPLDRERQSSNFALKAATEALSRALDDKPKMDCGKELDRNLLAALGLQQNPASKERGEYRACRDFRGQDQQVEMRPGRQRDSEVFEAIQPGFDDSDFTFFDSEEQSASFALKAATEALSPGLDEKTKVDCSKELDLGLPTLGLQQNPASKERGEYRACRDFREQDQQVLQLPLQSRDNLVEFVLDGPARSTTPNFVHQSISKNSSMKGQAMSSCYMFPTRKVTPRRQGGKVLQLLLQSRDNLVEFVLDGPARSTTPNFVHRSISRNSSMKGQAMSSCYMFPTRKVTPRRQGGKVQPTAGLPPLRFREELFLEQTVMNEFFRNFPAMTARIPPLHHFEGGAASFARHSGGIKDQALELSLRDALINRVRLVEDVASPWAKVIQQDATAQSLLRILKKSTVEVAKDECESQPDPWAEDQSEDDGLPLPPADLKVSRPTLDPIPEQSAAAPPQPAASSAAPVTQAARNLLDNANEPPASRRLRRQQELAQKKGKKSARFVQLGAHNACNISLPPHIQQVGSGRGERSIMVLDHRDQRLQSPFQGWLLDEILTNANARISITSDVRLLRSPTTGYHCNIFMMKTLDNFKMVLVGSMTSYGSVPCGRWDSETGAVLSHAAFQPFRWPIMRNDSPTWVDVKVKMEGQLLVHLELRGYRSDGDMTVQINHVSDTIVWLLQETPFIPTFVVTVFQGWRVCAVSWEVGGRIYAISEGGIVVALDYPLCHVELRLVATSSADAFGQDADRLEFRFYSAADRLDVACSTCAVPPSWLVVSRVSGPTLIKNARWCREHLARVESPDQALHLSQLASIHAHWTAEMEAQNEEGTGPRISAIAVESNPNNLHLISESALFRKEQAIVEKEALAIQAHDRAKEQATAVLPPITGGPAVQPANAFTSSMKAITGQNPVEQVVYPHKGVTLAQADVSITEPGVPPDQGTAASGRPLMPTRRSLDQRRGEMVDHSAMTPAGFVEQVRMMQQAGGSSAGNRSGHGGTDEIQIEFVDAVEGTEGSTSSQPRSFGPPTPQ
eukprot:symbB.v1.2.030648.t1/scaffold3477.1/size55879/5